MYNFRLETVTPLVQGGITKILERTIPQEKLRRIDSENSFLFCFEDFPKPCETYYGNMFNVRLDFII